MEFLLRRERGGWWLDATDTTTPEGRDPVRKRAMALHLSQAHTCTAKRNTVFKKYLPVFSHFLRTLTWHRISARTKGISSVLEYHGFPCFLMGSCQSLNAMGSLSYCRTTVSLCLSLSCSYFLFQFHIFCASPWQADFF